MAARLASVLGVPPGFFFGSSDRLAGIKPSVFTKCDEPLTHATELWIYQSADGTLRILPGQRTQDGPASIQQVDFGDFGSNGEQEALFSLAAYNEDGYLLFYDDFRKVARLTWGYH